MPQDKRALLQGSYAVEDSIGLDPAVGKYLRTEFPGAYQPTLKTGALGALHVRPKVVSHHCDQVRGAPKTLNRRVEELATGFPRYPGGLPGCELQAGHEGAGVEGESVVM